MSSKLERYEPYFAEPSQGELSKEVVCTDDGGMQDIHYAPQFAGGAYNMAIAVNTAYAIGGRIPEFANLSLDARKAAALTGATSHVECAAMEGAESLDRQLLATPEEVYRRAELLVPGAVSQVDMEAALSAAEFRLDPQQGMHMSLKRVLEVMAKETEEAAKVAHLHLHRDGGHTADVMIANDVAGSYYDTRQAYDNRDAAYGFTVHRLGEIGMQLEALFPTVAQDDAFLKAAVIHHAVVSQVLPNSTGKSGVQPLYRGENFAKVA